MMLRLKRILPSSFGKAGFHGDPAALACAPHFFVHDIMKQAVDQVSHGQPLARVQFERFRGKRYDNFFGFEKDVRLLPDQLG